MNDNVPIGCCGGLRTAISNAGGVGVSALVEREADVYKMLIQYRATDASGEEVVNIACARWFKQSGDRAKTLRLVTQMVARFCPWCGTDLEALLADTETEAHELLQLHEPFRL